ncbi:MAG: pilus assembly protein PilM [Patescibacteria group bacterium]
MFRHAYSVGIDISDHSIEILRLNANRIVEAYNRVVLDDGIVRDGAILDVDGLTAKLREALTGISLRSAAVMVSLPESRLFMRVFQVPAGAGGESLRQALYEEARGAIPYPQEKAYWDFIPAGRNADGAGQVLFVGAPKETVEAYASLVKSVGIRLAVIDVESLSTGRALLPVKGIVQRLRQEEENAAPSSMIVDIGARTTSISIFDEDNALMASETVPVAGSRFSRALIEKLKTDERSAESLKRQDGLERKGAAAVAPILEA